MKRQVTVRLRCAAEERSLTRSEPAREAFWHGSMCGRLLLPRFLPFEDVVVLSTLCKRFFADYRPAAKRIYRLQSAVIAHVVQAYNEMASSPRCGILWSWAMEKFWLFLHNNVSVDRKRNAATWPVPMRRRCDSTTLLGSNLLLMFFVKPFISGVSHLPCCAKAAAAHPLMVRDVALSVVRTRFEAKEPADPTQSNIAVRRVTRSDRHVRATARKELRRLSNLPKVHNPRYQRPNKTTRRAPFR